MPRRLATIAGLCCFAVSAVFGRPSSASAATTLQDTARTYWSGYLFLDPDPNVGTKEFTLFHNTVPDPTAVPDSLSPSPLRTLFHIIYQRSGGPHASERTFGHAWSQDLQRWTVDTLAFAVDTTWWCKEHVWSPCFIHRGNRDYLFFTGVDSANDQRIGYASTALLDTTDTVWDPVRKLCLQAEDTHWAVPDPWMYGGATQFRDPYVLPDPDDPGRLLLIYTAVDSIDFKLGRGTLAVGVARSAPGSTDVWEDLGFYPTTLR